MAPALPHGSVSALQRRTVALVDPVFQSGRTAEAIRIHGGQAESRRSVIFVLMESTALRETESRAEDGSVLMPNLKRLRREGLDFKNHFSTANYTAGALAGLFSGLYLQPGHGRLPLREDFAPPLLNRLGGFDGNCVLVSGADSRIYFPDNLFRKNRWKLLGYDQIAPRP